MASLLIICSQVDFLKDNSERCEKQTIQATISFV
jgi:hypothetical protein